MDALESGNVREVLNNLTIPVLRAVVNIIGNVLHNPQFRMTAQQKRTLKPHAATYKFLLNRKVSPEAKKRVLRKKGATFLPTFLDVVGDDLQLFLPREVNRKRKNCPVCGKKNLLKLSNHLGRVHNLKGEERKEKLQEAEYGFDSADDQGNESSHQEDA